MVEPACQCDKARITKFWKEEVAPTDVYTPQACIIKDTGQKVFDLSNMRMQVPGECSWCYEKYKKDHQPDPFKV